MCDFKTCENEALYDGMRMRESCVTSQNKCQFVRHVEEKKFCQKPKGESSGNCFILNPFQRVFQYQCIRDGSKFIGYSGRDHRQGGEDFFSKKKGGEDFFSEKIRGRSLFFD